MAVNEIVDGVMNRLSTWLVNIENGMSSLEDELTDSLKQAEEEQMEWIEGMFCSHKANIKNLHKHVNDLSDIVLAVFKSLQKTQMEV
ncbi:hypothetical protein C0995_004084, partial [Termitomyces sp. Mi166